MKCELLQMIPVMKTQGLTTEIITDCGAGIFQREIRNTSYDDYIFYLTALKNSGFKQYVDNGTKGLEKCVWNSVYIKDDLVVTVIYVAKRNRTYISVGRDICLSKHLFYQDQYVSNNCKVKTNKANVSWYSESEDEFTITTVEELYDLAALSDFYDFEDQTILLGADLVINEGDAADWAENAPENTWFPIQGFAGTFDGQGHTISGMYGYGISTPMGLFSDTSADCEIRDFKLVNSYFYVDGSQGVGSITSNGSGTFEKIYSDAIVSTSHFYAGGLIGRVDSGRGSSVIASSSKMSDCWFDGEINLISEKSRLGGGLIGAISNGTMRANHCLSTAKINCPEELQAWRVGGFCGAVGIIGETNSKATMFTEDCLSVAEILDVQL